MFRNSEAVRAQLEPRFVSADSHVTEPADLWCERLDRALRDRAPRVVRDYAGDRYLFVAPGVRPFAIATGFGAGKQGDELKRHLHRGYEAARRGGWDPAARISDQDADGVSCEVLYPTHGMRLFGLPDADLQGACFRVYNDWICEFATYDRLRLVPLALIPLYDVDVGVRELERVAERRAGGAMIGGAPPEGAAPYGDRKYDRFWAAAAALRLPVSMHCITTERAPTSISPYVQYLDVIHDVQRSLAEIVCDGVLERFPSLTIVSAENDCGWMPHFFHRLDHAHEKFGKYAARPLPEPPSSYLRRQVYATFQEDSSAALTLPFFGEDNYLWASDYPHVDSTWPKSRAAIRRALNGLPDCIFVKIVGGNAQRLYGC
jgi:predicted TIM-barrel fold metal-dependent hydrolase